MLIKVSCLNGFDIGKKKVYISFWGPLVNTKFLTFSGLSLVIVWLSTHSYYFHGKCVEDRSIQNFAYLSVKEDIF